mmetsp:Transcript_21126/g.43869  ORF Transcript_21126/g.43869 Transcript_21126/m.43869 type:complete len:319 (-) Transcript_21126:484-1440(-)
MRVERIVIWNSVENLSHVFRARRLHVLHPEMTQLMAMEQEGLLRTELQALGHTYGLCLCNLSNAPCTCEQLKAWIDYDYLPELRIGCCQVSHHVRKLVHLARNALPLAEGLRRIEKLGVPALADRMQDPGDRVCLGIGVRTADARVLVDREGADPVGPVQDTPCKHHTPQSARVGCQKMVRQDVVWLLERIGDNGGDQRGEEATPSVGHHPVWPQGPAWQHLSVGAGLGGRGWYDGLPNDVGGRVLLRTEVRHLRGGRAKRAVELEQGPERDAPLGELDDLPCPALIRMRPPQPHELLSVHDAALLLNMRPSLRGPDL